MNSNIIRNCIIALRRRIELRNTTMTAISSTGQIDFRIDRGIDSEDSSWGA